MTQIVAFQNNSLQLKPKNPKPKIQKPKVVLIYNQYKAGVDLVDQKTGEYTCQRTRRWTVALFMNLLDIVTHNSFILFTTAQPSWKQKQGSRKKLFLAWLAKALCIEQVKHRISLPHHNQGTRALMTIFVENFKDLYEGLNSPTAKCETCFTKENIDLCKACNAISCHEHGKRQKLYRCQNCDDDDIRNVTIQHLKHQRCEVCPRRNDKKATVYCCGCKLFMCGEHDRSDDRYFICNKCGNN